MSPVAGVGVNLVVQAAVATAKLLALKFTTGCPSKPNSTRYGGAGNFQGITARFVALGARPKRRVRRLRRAIDILEPEQVHLPDSRGVTVRLRGWRTCCGAKMLLMRNACPEKRADLPIPGDSLGWNLNFNLTVSP
jgi:hypothetical protein